MGRFETATACDNMNHRRANAPVSHCPQCGGVVNKLVAIKQCSEAHHAAARRDRGIFCVDCGTQLIFDR
jgi:predicted RNA-binding Zn-ribbon protein involved in translation (DUF1610 family)